MTELKYKVYACENGIGTTMGTCRTLKDAKDYRRQLKLRGLSGIVIARDGKEVK